MGNDVMGYDVMDSIINNLTSFWWGVDEYSLLYTVVTH